jgi:rsbT co-antagonist protein RsbR
MTTGKKELITPTPVTILWDNILMLPIVGTVDSMRGQEIMDTMLSKILESEASVIILDILGVPIVDTAVSNHLLKITSATGLMGCQCIITGISPSIAQALVSLGVDMSSVITKATLRDGLKAAFDIINIEVREKRETARK